MKIAVLSCHTSSLFWFRMDMMKEFIDKNHKVIALGSESEIDWKAKFEELNIDYRQLHVDRNSINPVKDFKTFFELLKFMKKEKPDKVFAYQAKTVIYGSIAAKLNGITEVYTLIAGLGSIFRGVGLKNRIVKSIMKVEYSLACKCSKKVFFQNNDDRDQFTKNNLVKENKTVIINGSGVNLEKFKPVPLPEAATFLFIGRLIKDKGIMEYLEACKGVRKEYANIRCLVVGPYDSNPSALKPEELKRYIDNGIVEYFGEQRDVRPYISDCSTYVLPSYHEGTPKTVLEAMAMGRAIITTNAPGCKETVTDGVNGFLVEVKDVKGIINKMVYLIENPRINQSMGENSLKIATSKYDVRIINQAILNAMGLVENRRMCMTLYDEIVNREEKIALIGLGYVGLPIAVAFSKKANVIGFDVNRGKIDLYKKGVDPTKEVGNDLILNCSVDFTSDETRLKEAKFHIIAVPTPVNTDHTPDLSPVESASRTLGRNLTKGSIVVYESTVYPGVTEDICVPILEKESGLKCGVEFKVGYSPERINPGDKKHRLNTIVKIVSGMDEETLDIIAKVYELVVDAGVHRAESIKVAEAAKVIENSQRDINIAFMNELSIIFNKMGIDTNSVLSAASTKWNFLNFKPGLVGGHCIGVDPYYLTYKAEELGYHSQIILSGRKINDDMGKYVAENTVKKMIKANKQINRSKVAIFGITFKENCPDVRNTKVIDIIKELEEYGVEVMVIDPVADKEGLWNEYGINTCNMEDIKDIDAAIFAVSHEEFKSLRLEDIKKMYNTSVSSCSDAMDEVAAVYEECTDKSNYVLIDVKGIFDKKEAEEMNYIYWRL